MEESEMNMKRYFKNILHLSLITLLGLFAAFPASAAKSWQVDELIKCNAKLPSAFAIFIDSEAFAECREQVMEYRNVLESEGLATYIVSANWETPEQVRDEIAKLAAKKPVLEGMVFIGDIPIARIRKGQHLTTAFKMNESTFPMVESSVTSDRFYDTPAMKFEYIGQDSTNARYFYYNLLSSGAQVIVPAYYSGRIMVPRQLVQESGKSEYELLGNYLEKVVAAHKEEQNTLDRFIHFAGHGYNSDCLTAWRQQAIAFRDYFPDAFKSSEGNKFYNFRQDPVMKYTLFTQLQRPGTDLFMFYEHGAPDTQYINGDYPAVNTGDCIEQLKYTVRRGYARVKAENRADYIKDVTAHFGLNPDEFTEEQIIKYKAQDSTFAADKDILLPDLAKLKTAPRVTIFNACYNGSFHEAGYVAGYHIFNDGNTVVTQGNTVNVLQDKWAEQLISLLYMGARAGFWQNEVVTLESHLVGDPTFRFATPAALEGKSSSGFDYSDINNILLTKGAPAMGASPAFRNSGENAAGLKEYWSGILEDENPALRALALKQLQKLYMYGNVAFDFSDLAYGVYENDPSMTVRLQALYALSICADENFLQAIKEGFGDPYEMIRRQSAHFAGKVGDESLVEYLCNALEDSPEVQRVNYAAGSALACFKVDSALIKEYGDKVYLRESELLDINSKRAVSDMRSMRNYPSHWQVDNLLSIMKDSNVDLEKRLVLCEALGWCNYSVNREKIASALEAQLSSEVSMPDELREEMMKTIKRLRMSVK